MGRPQSINDAEWQPANEVLNKIQRTKIRDIVIENSEEPETALLKVKDYCSNIAKIKIRAITFDSNDCPTTIQVFTNNTTHFFALKKKD